MNKSRLIEQLKYDEGVVDAIYLDPLGLPTFGIGHLITKSDPEYGQPIGTPVSHERVMEVFHEDVERYIAECEILYGDQWDLIPGEIQEILVNMMFNLGRPRLAGFKRMRAAIDAQDWETAAMEGRDSKWARQVTKRADRLMDRMEQYA